MTPERLQEIEASIGRIECPECGGSGVHLDVPTGNEACDECDGSGMVSQFPPADELIAAVRTLTADLAHARAERDAALQEAAAAQAAWASDVAEWKEWLLGAEQARDGWQQLAEQAEAALTEARRVLREVQWDRSGECPMCGGLRDGDTHVYHASHVEVVRGHFPACALATVLAQESR